MERKGVQIKDTMAPVTLTQWTSATNSMVLDAVQACEKGFMTTALGQPEFGQPDYQNSVEEKYMREPLAFYKELNVAYVEEKRRYTMECDRATLLLCHSESVGTRGSYLSFDRL